MLRKRLYLITFLGFMAAGCASFVTTSGKAPPVSPIRSVKDISDAKKSLFIEYPTPDRFSICHGHTCRYTVDVSLSDVEWVLVKDLFDTSASGPVNEREQIQKAIGLLETIVGEKTNTSEDKGGNFAGLGLQGQMDCIDESTNTTVYLTMLQKKGLLKWHQVNRRTSRGIFSLQAPHFTAVIGETDSNKDYAVDSWFLDNGHPPYIIPLKKWERGWEPQL